MAKIVIMGTGNIARHLFDAFKEQSSLEVVQVVGRNQKALGYFKRSTKTSTNFKNLTGADIYMLAVSDDSIYAVCEDINITGKLVVHCSGSIDMTAMPPGNRRGVFYPVQTFSKGRKVEFREVPICIEAENISDLDALNRLATLLSRHVHTVDSTQRSHVHLAAVFVNNFTNYLYGVGAEICQANGLPFAILEPLIRETAAKITEVSPIMAQTGPARRADGGTIAKHLGLLKQKNYLDIYAILSQSIGDIYWDENGMPRK